MLWQAHYMAYVATEASLPLDFQSFIASINNVFHFLDVIPNSWLHYSFKPSEEDVKKLYVLPTNFQIPKLDPPDLAKAPCSWAADQHYSVQQDTLVPDNQKPNYMLFAPPEVGPATRSTLLSVPAEKPTVPPVSSPIMAKTGPLHKTAPTSGQVEVVIPHPLVLSSDMSATPNTRSKHQVAPLLSKDVPQDPPRATKCKASSKSVSSMNAPLPVSKKTLPQVQWSLKQTFIDYWLHLESLLCLTLRRTTDLYGGPVTIGMYTFLNPISYHYTERNASLRSSTIDIALRSHDAFLPMMVKITLMFILLNVCGPGDWRAHMLQQTKLHWQWLIDLEHSAVGDFTIDHMGGIIDLTRSKSHPDEHLPWHACWLLPHLLSKHRIPLYFFYSQGFPLKEPIPDALVKIGFVPDLHEVNYLQSLPGDVAFSPWSFTASVCKSRRDGAPLSTPPSSHVPPTYQHSEIPADSSLPAVSFPAVECDSGQKPGEDIHAFMECCRLHNEKRAQHETPQAKGKHLTQENHAIKGGPPGKKGAHVFIWEEGEGGFFIQHACNHTDAAECWDEFISNQRIYDGFSNRWDLCTALAPNKEAEPDDMYNDNNDYNNNYVHFHQPASPADIIPSIPDVPGRQAMGDETGERAGQVLERAYNLDPDDLYEDAVNLPGWRMQDVLSTIPYHFGFEEPVAPISSSWQMGHKACVWAIGNEHWAVPDASALLTFLQHLVEGNVTGFQAELCDLSSPGSDLELEWNVDIKIFNILKTGAHMMSRNGEEAPWHEALILDKINLICRVYSIEMGTFI
ncbi:hypothetical protein B0H14DRAFT_3503022 [Mycena olivaceomarginata]|nr:hypothetical protein B0H14DRAFT_3503022 [Mycena olivaceomarginata]